MESETGDGSDVNLKGYKRLNQDDVIPLNLPVEAENLQQRIVGFDNRAYQSGSDVDNM